MNVTDKIGLLDASWIYKIFIQSLIIVSLYKMMQIKLNL